jgi:hypothetical protein
MAMSGVWRSGRSFPRTGEPETRCSTTCLCWAKAVPDEFRAAHPEIPWRSMSGLRDVLAHGYFGIDDEIIWDVAKNKLRELIERLENLLS